MNLGLLLHQQNYKINSCPERRDKKHCFYPELIDSGNFKDFKGSHSSMNKIYINSIYKGEPVPLITVPVEEASAKKEAIAKANTDTTIPIIKIL